MKHIDAYVLYKYGHKYIPEWRPIDTAFFLSSVMDFPINVRQLELYFDKEPKTNYVVNALHDKGIQAKTIAEWMNLNKGTVSYHLNKPIKKPYINPALKMAIQKFDESTNDDEYN